MEHEERDISEKCWFALRVTYNRELKVKEELDAKRVECFIPMRYKYVVQNEKRVRRLVPSVHNLLFVRMSYSEMKEFKRTTQLPVRYIMNRESHKPIVIPESQMRNFIAVSGTNAEQLVYISPCELKAKKGDKVRILGGLFAGCEGVFMRIKGDRRVVVSIPGVVAVATAFIHPSMIEKLE